MTLKIASTDFLNIRETDMPMISKYPFLLVHIYNEGLSVTHIQYLDFTLSSSKTTSMSLKMM